MDTDDFGVFGICVYQCSSVVSDFILYSFFSFNTVYDFGERFEEAVDIGFLAVPACGDAQCAGGYIITISHRFDHVAGFDRAAGAGGTVGYRYALKVERHHERFR